MTFQAHLRAADAAAVTALVPFVRRCSALALAALLACPGLAQAQTQAADAPLTRAQVKMEREEFMRTHRWHEATQTWMLRDGVEPPAGVKTRAEVKAERDAFVRTHRWDERVSGWVPREPAPRESSSLSRAQVKRDTVQFLRTHVWDEATETYVPRNRGGKR